MAIDTTLQGALDKVFSGDSGATTSENEDETGTPPETTTPGGTTTQTQDQIVSDALTEAEAQFQAAQDALQRGDLAGYQKANEAAQAAVEKALEAMGQ